MSSPIKTQTADILIVDDSLTFRMILRSVLQDIPGANVVGTAGDGVAAMEYLQAESAPDLILLDVEMPRMNGIETLRKVIEKNPEQQVVMVSGANRQNATITIEALDAGAFDFVSKPDSADMDQSRRLLKEALEPIVHHCLKRQVASRPQTQAAAEMAPSRAACSASSRTPDRPFAPKVLAIGISTGGPRALNGLIPALPADLGIPVLIVQHMPPMFTASLAESLDKRSALTVKEAEDRESIQPNTVYLAPGGQHMVVHPTEHGAQGRISLSMSPPEHGCRPAADVMFRSLPSTYGGDVLGVVMTGMGGDGALGLKELKSHGAYSLTQSEATCVVYGMPRTVEEMGLSDEVLDLDALASRITELVQLR